MGRKDKAIPSKDDGVLPLGARMRLARQQKCISLTEMSRLLAFTKSYLSAIENGVSKPSVELVEKYERVLEIEPGGLPYKSDEIQLKPRDLRSSPPQENRGVSVDRINRRSVNQFSAQMIHFPTSDKRLVQEDWGEAPSLGNFYGREQEIAELEHWVTGDQCQIVSLLGIGGVGKTSLAVELTEHIKDRFEYIFWRSLQNAPPIESVLRECIYHLSNRSQRDLPEDIEDQVTLLMNYLREHRCLFVLDNFESVLQGGNSSGQYLEGYEGYGMLLHRIVKSRHQSCLLMTSREKPRELSLLDGKTPTVQVMQISGVEQAEARKILRDEGLFGTDESWGDFITLYAGNPLALKLVSESISELFQGDIAAFLREEEALVGDVYDLLDKQFHRLSELEQEIMYWLAIERDSISLDDLREDIVRMVSKGELLEALQSLRSRSLIETSGIGRFTLQPVIMEYVISELLERLYKEIDEEKLRLFDSHALIKVQTKDYLRASQVRLILRPLSFRLLTTYGKERSEIKLSNILLELHKLYSQKPGYAAGNVLNLLIHLGCNLRGYDFSRLVVWQAYLQGEALPDVNFAHSDLSRSVFTDPFGSIFSIALSLDGELLAAGTATEEILLWQTSSGTPLLKCIGHTNWIKSVAFSPNGHLLASGSEDQTVRLWKVSTGQCLKTLYGHGGRVYSVAFSPDGSLLASGSDDQTIRVWDVNTGKCLKELQGHDSRVWSVAFNPDGRTIASGGGDRTVRLWELDTDQCLKVLQGHTNWVKSVTFSPDGNLLASGSDDQTVRVWDVSTGQCLMTLQGHSSWIWSVTFSSNRNLIISGSEDRTIRLWEISSGKCLKTLQGHSNRSRSVAFSPDGKLLANGCDDQMVRVWEVNTGYCLKILRGHSSRIRSVAFSPDGSLLASGSDDQMVRVWEVNTGHCLKTFQGHSGRVWAIAFSPDGNIIASCSDDQTIRLWEMNSDQNPQVLEGHNSRVYSVAFSPDGNLLASGGQDYTARLWEVSTGECLLTLRGHTNKVRSLSFNSEGSLLVTGSTDDTFKLWNVQSGECIRTLRSERPYEHMNITDVRGLTTAQKATLRELGAIEELGRRELSIE